MHSNCTIRYHVSPPVVVRFRNHSFHAETALNPLVGIHPGHEEVVLHRAENGQVVGDELAQGFVSMHGPPRLHARHEVVVLLPRVDPHLALVER